MYTVYLFYFRMQYLDLIGNDLCFYSLPENTNDDRILVSRNLSLYAITEDKKLAKLFRRTRDMNCFIERIVEIDDEDWEAFLNDTVSFWIVKERFITILERNGIACACRYNLYVPRGESNMIKVYADVIVMEHIETVDALLSDGVATCITEGFLPKIFNQESFHKLDHLQFFDFIAKQYPIEEELPFDPINYNEISLYLDIYGKLYQKGGFKKLCECGDFTWIGANKST